MTLLKTPSRVWEGVIFVCLCCGQMLFAQETKPSKATLDYALRLYQSGDLGHACPLIDQDALESPQDPIAGLYRMGCAIHGKNTTSIRMAIEVFDESTHSGVHEHQTAGEWLAAGGFCAEAKREFLMVPSADTAAVRFDIGHCYEAIGNATLASTEYEDALRLNPDKEDYYLALAILLMAGGKSPEAANVLLQSAARFPDSVRTIIAMSLLHLELGYPERARLGYERAKQLAPDSPGVWKLQGRIQMAEGDFDQAAKSFEQAATIDRRDAQTYFLLGMADEKTEGGADKALEALRRAVNIDLNLNEARILAASIYLEDKKDFRKATVELEAALAAEPGSIRAHRLLMQVYQRQGMTQKAIAEAQAVRRLSVALPDAGSPEKQ